MSAQQSNAPYAFVCYAHEDAAVVYPEIEWLSGQGVGIWYDQGISPGSNWRSEIGDSLLGARHVVFFISGRSLQSDHCNREINLALDEGIDVVPVYLEQVALTPDFKIGLSRLQALNYDAADYRMRLLGVLRGSEPVPAMPHSTPPVSRSRRQTYVVALLAAAMLATGVLAFIQYRALPVPAELEGATTAAPDLQFLSSIAVLPFTSFSDQPDVGFFAQGLCDRILDVLAQCDLRVASRTTTFQLAREGIGIQALAEKLNVAYVMEGSAQQLGTTVRVTAQLIRAREGFHVWSKTYERDATDGFKIQDEIASNLAQLAQSMLHIDVARQHPELFEQYRGVKPEALGYYLEAEEQYNRSIMGEGGDVGYAMQLTERAVAIDPGFKAAQVELAWNYMMRVDPGIPIPKASASAHRAIEKALAFEPDSGQAYLILAQLFIRLDLDYASAEVAINRGQEITPAGGWWPVLLAEIAHREERDEEALRYLKRAAAIDFAAESPFFFNLYARALLIAKRYDQSLRVNDQALRLLDGGRLHAEALLIRAEAMLELNRVADAKTLIAQAWSSAGAEIPEAFAYFFAKTGDAARAENILNATQPSVVNRAPFIAGHLALGEFDRGLEMLREGIEDHDVSVFDTIGGDPKYDVIRNDPRFVELLEALDAKVKHTARYLELHTTSAR